MFASHWTGCLRATLAATLLLTSSVTAAEENGAIFDRIHLSAEATREVQNDTLVVVLYTQHEGRDARKLAESVNADLHWALGKSAAVKSVTTRTLDYHTTPVYQNKSVTGWRVRQSMRLQSRDKTALSELLGTLQERLKIQNVSSKVSDAARRKAEETLISEAIAAFRQRARVIAAQFEFDNYRLVEVNVATNGNQPRPVLMRANAMEMQASSAPALEAGTATLQVTVSGSIQLHGE
jgi:predicted secreted protein